MQIRKLTQEDECDGGYDPELCEEPAQYGVLAVKGWTEVRACQNHMGQLVGKLLDFVTFFRNGKALEIRGAKKG